MLADTKITCLGHRVPPGPQKRSPGALSLFLQEPRHHHFSLTYVLLHWPELSCSDPTPDALQRARIAPRCGCFSHRLSPTPHSMSQNTREQENSWISCSFPELPEHRDRETAVGLQLTAPQVEAAGHAGSGQPCSGSSRYCRARLSPCGPGCGQTVPKGPLVSPPNKATPREEL